MNFVFYGCILSYGRSVVGWLVNWESPSLVCPKGAVFLPSLANLCWVMSFDFRFVYCTSFCLEIVWGKLVITIPKFKNLFVVSSKETYG